MRKRVVIVILLFLASVNIVRAQPKAELDRPEVQRLCKKWDGTLVATRPTGPAYLRCSHIRTQFDRAAKGETLFKPIRSMVESVKDKNLLNLKASDLPKDQKCTIEKGSNTVMTCTTLDFEPEVSTRFFGTKSGALTRAVVSADTDWFRREATRQIQSQYGVPPTRAFLDFYLELLVTVSSLLGGPSEQYSLTGNKVVLTLTLR